MQLNHIENIHHAAVSQALISRWPEHRVAPSLARVQALCDLLGQPQQACPVIQITGTNGKGSTAALIDALLRSTGLRTGLFTSPHLSDVTERIVIDGRPISAERFDELFDEISPMVDLVDEMQIDGVSMTFFEVITAMAYSAFADAPVDVAVVEVGMGGTWDATSVANAQIAVVCPIDLDHTGYLGETISAVATEKAGIIKSETMAAVIAGQTAEAAKVLLDRCADLGVRPVLEGPDFSVVERTTAVGGQLLRLDTPSEPVADLHLPLHGAHMAHNAALALAAVQSFLGGRTLSGEVINDGLADVHAPARLELVRTSPSVLIDTCHNVHGATATMAAMEEAFAFTPLIGVVAMMADKDVDAVLPIFAGSMSQVVVTRVSGTDRGMDVAELTDRAQGVFGSQNVHAAANMAAALEVALQLADEAGPAVGVLVAGSVIAAGEARDLLRRELPEQSDEPLGLEVGSNEFGGGPTDQEW